MFSLLLFVIGFAGVIGDVQHNNEEPVSIIGTLFRHAGKFMNNNDDKLDHFVNHHSNDNNHAETRTLVRNARDVNMAETTEIANIFPVKCPKGRIRVGWKCIPKDKKH